MSQTDNLQKADGKKETHTEDSEAIKPEASTEAASKEHTEKEITTAEEKKEEVKDEKKDDVVEDTEEPSETLKEEPQSQTEDTATDKPTKASKEAPKSEKENTATAKKEDHVDEIDSENAEDAEDESNAERHNLKDEDYHAMSMEKLAESFEKLLKTQKIQNISKHVNEIKSEFNSKFSALLDEKKEAFISDGGNPIDFYYTNDTKKKFNSVYKEYKKTITQYYRDREAQLKQNLENRLQIIEEIKGLLNVEENISTTYKTFKDLQEQWRNAGPIPRDKYNNAWNSYHHHVEHFYDFLHLNRDLRDMDFKHNLDQKLKIIERAEELAKDENINRAFRELQVLHKMWKEELGPVAKEHREEIWNRFSTATKAIHDKRQAYYADLDKAYEKNLVRKEEIISKIEAIAKEDTNSHGGWQKKIKLVEALRDDFFNAGKVPIKVNEATWSKFKTAVRDFNRKKNKFYKNLKKGQYENLQKKKELIKIAEDNKDSDDFDSVTPLMKKIQSDWKKIGHVPRKDSDKIWKKFKKACNHYFDRMHAERRAENQELYDNFDTKTKLLEDLKSFKTTDDPKADVETLKAKINEFRAVGYVPQNKRFIDGKFNKALDAAFSKLDMDKAKLDMIRFENKLENLSKPDDTRLLDNEQNFIRKRISEIKGDINQLENNLQFFSNVEDDNPLVKEVHKNIANHKKELETWKKKLKKVKGMYSEEG
ncbi:DUF349 domain-containing protein [Winogradskyella sp. A3E31]|uniref:DUF349 domain-containing protein n=1 Tax=Winogradskyella sp. A3E31 TaxID=3349637 RepID=UPI00398B7D38